MMGTGLNVSAQKTGSEDKKLLQEAKLLIFDKAWIEAGEKLDELITRHPKSSFYSQALFYRGKCLAEQKGKEEEALRSFEAFLSRPDRPESLVEEAEIAVIDLAFSLYEKGQKNMSRVLQEKLASPSKVIRYYAAMKLSYSRDKNLAARALPVLKELIKKEKDQELVDRAKIALLRISPEALKDVPESQGKEALRLVKIRVYEKGKKTPSVSINIPLALADLAIQAISEEDKARMVEKGYDPEKIISDLARSKEKLIRIEDEGNIIEIWIE
jgi:hypothetical protein